MLRKVWGLGFRGEVLKILVLCFESEGSGPLGSVSGMFPKLEGVFWDEGLWS